MEYQINKSHKIKGIIYLYISPSTKCYVGQTINEDRRRWCFLNSNTAYGGKAIDSARMKYSPESFIYEVIYEDWFTNKEQAKEVLNEVEKYYIELFDSFDNGYNLNIGGGSGAGYKFNEEQLEAKSEITKEQWKDDEFKEYMKEINLGDKNPASRPVAVYNLLGDLIDLVGTVKDAFVKHNFSSSSINKLLNDCSITPKRLSFRYIEKDIYQQILKTKIVPDFIKFDSELRGIRLVAQIDYSTKNIINIFESETIAATETGTYKGSINKVLNKTRDTAGGFGWERLNRLQYYKWKYKTEYGN